jgi:hypothetical protein
MSKRGLVVYGRRLALFPLAYATVDLARLVLSPWFLRRFEAELERRYQQGLARGAPPVPPPRPTRMQVAKQAACIGALRGFGFALVRPALPRQTEAAAVTYTAIGTIGLVIGFRSLVHLFDRQQPVLQWPSARTVRNWTPAIGKHAALTAAIERALDVSQPASSRSRFRTALISSR